MAKKKKVGKKRARATAAKKALSPRKKKAAKASGKAKAQPAKAKAKAKPAKAKPAKASPAKSKPARAKPAKASPALGEGASAPSFELADQDGNLVSSSSLKGQSYVLYFYPKDDTTGCTKEACDFRDFSSKFGGVRVVGVSPDSIASHAKFRAKYGLSFTLISDADKTLAQAYGVWVKKRNYGREYMGIERSTFLIDEQGKIKKAWRGVRVAGHVENVLASL